MRGYILLVLFLLSSSFVIAQERHYRDLMADPNVNVNEVIRVADAWFETHPKGKGSGYKGYQRWLILNQNTFGIDGERRSVDPYLYLETFQKLAKEKRDIQGTSTARTSATGWRDLGPYRVDSITHHYSAGVGRVEDFYVNPASPQNMYLSGNYGGFWKTSNGGVSWTGTTDTLPASGVRAIAVSPSNPDSLLICSGANPFMGIYRSVDAGDTWQTTAFNPTTLGLGGLGSTFLVQQIKYHPTIRDLVFVVTRSGLFRSTNDLQTWTQVYAGDMRDLAFHPTNPNILYTYDASPANKYRVLRSFDAGLNFSLSDSIPVGYSWEARLDVSSDCPDCLYLGAQLGLWRSVDQGQTFTQLSNINSEAQYLKVSDLDTSVVLIGAVDIHQSLDGGRNFTQKTWWSTNNTPFDGPHYIHADPRNLQFINGQFYVSTDGYLTSSADSGNTWTRYSEGVGLRECYALSVSQCNYGLSITGSQDNGSSLLLDSLWIEFFGGDGMDPLAHPLNEDWFIASTQSGGRYRSVQKGQDILSVKPYGQTSQFVGKLLQNPFLSTGAFHFGRKIYASTNYGSTWTTTGIQPFGNFAIAEAAVANNNPDIMYVSGWQEIKRTMDGGLTFTTIPAPMPANGPSEILTAPNNDSIVVMTFNTFVADSQKVFISRDFGNTWENITFNLHNMPLWSIAIDHTDSTNIYVAGQIGVYTKSLNGQHWQLYNDNLPNVMVRKLAINYGANTLRAATYGRGLWEIPLVDRGAFPCIGTAAITNPPTLYDPMEGFDQFVTSKISYGGNLTSVYLHWSTDPLALDSTIVMSNTVDSTWVSDQAIPNYPAGTNIYFTVNAVGQLADTSVSYRYQYTVKEFDPYCGASGYTINPTGLYYIDSVALQGIQNGSGFDLYGDYRNQVASLQAGANYSIHVNLNFSSTIDSTLMWIDFNHDFIFADSEQVMLNVTSNLVRNGNIQVPANVPIGDTVRMRIKDVFFNNSTTYGPCGEHWGEVEDYSIVFRATPNVGYLLSDSSFCANETLQFQYTGDVMDSLLWVFSNGASTWSYTTLSDSLQLALNGDYNLSLTGYQGGTPYQILDTAIFNVTAPSVIANSSLPAICIGDSVSVFGSGANAYAWTGGVTDGIPFYPNASTNFVVTGTDLNGCTDTASVTIQVNALPSVIANVSSNSICVGDSLVLSGSGANTYSWDGGVSNGIPFYPTANGSYIVTGTDLNGCIDTASIAIQVNPLPSISSNATATMICFGEMVTLNGFGGNSYIWSGGVQNGLAFSPTSTSAYQVTGTNSNGCSDTASITIQVNTLPSISINASATSICVGNSVTLSGQGGTSYTWAGGVQNGVPFSPGVSATYQVTGTGANLCTDTASIFIEVNPNPNVGISGTATSVCEGESLTLSGMGANTYTWTGGITNGMPFVPMNSGSYQVTGYDLNNCEDSASISIAVISIDTNVNSSATTLTAAASGLSYQWLDCSNGFNPIGGATGVTFMPSSNGTYAVQITGNGCVDTSGCHTVIVTAIQGNSFNDLITVYPNPSQGLFQINLGQIHANVELQVYDDLGKLVLQQTHQVRSDLELDLSEMADGSYLILLYSELGNASMMVIKRE